MEESLNKNMENLVDHFPLHEEELRTYNALAFAYIGDAIYDVMIRTLAISKGNNRPNRYHKQVTKLVNAAAHTEMIHQILPELTEEEKNIYRRGRNSKSFSPAKNQSHHDYRIATGFEALIGYLYLCGRMDRATQLVSIGIDRMTGEEEDGV